MTYNGPLTTPTMPAEDDLSDDYVASVLAKDAKDSSLTYSAMGLEAFLPKRSNTNAPKPNTRFLRNIIRETDTHNAALLTKENAEARNRLRQLRGALSSRGQETRRHESRQNRDRGQDEGEQSSKRQRLDSKDDSKGRDRSYHSRSRKDQSHDRREASDVAHISRRSRRHRTDSESDRKHSRRPEYDGHRSRSPSHRHRHRRRAHRSRSTSPSRHHRHRSRRKHRSSSPAIEIPTQSVRSSRSSPSNDDHGNEQGSDSDPLASLIGPKSATKAVPKVRRGRGSFAGPSNMSSRFSSTYDPATDVLPDESDPDDWDQALEALRDRQKWKTQGAERLRAAGFGDEAVKKWESSGKGIWGKGTMDEVDGGDAEVDHVRWAKKGEGREWDRGKVVDSDGIVDVQAAWAQ